MSPHSDYTPSDHSGFELKTLLDTSRLLIESHDLDFVLNNLLLITMGKLMATRALVLLHEPEMDRYKVSSIKGRVSLKEGQNLTFRQTRKLQDTAFFTLDEQYSGLLPDRLKDSGISYIFNIRTSYQHLGFLCLGPKSNGEQLGDHEAQFIETLVILSAAAIANSRLVKELRSTNRELDYKVQELHTLFDLSKEFNSTLHQDQIGRIFKFALMGQMMINHFFLAMETSSGYSIIADNGMTYRPSHEEILAVQHDNRDVRFVDEELAARHPVVQKNNIQLLINLDFQDSQAALLAVGPRPDIGYADSDVNFLISLGNLTLLSYQKTYLLEEQIEKKRMEKELNIARDIQKKLLPDAMPELDNVQLAGRNYPSQQVGGDYFDVIKRSESQTYLSIADVTGKGVPASLLMANLQSMIHILTPLELSLAGATDKINDIMYTNTPSDKFISFFWGCLNTETRTFTYVNAGHNPPLLFRGNDEEPKNLHEGGLLLGAMPTMTPYQEGRVELQPGDLIVFYTDGVTEARNADNEEYEEHRLMDCVQRNRQAAPQSLLETIVDDVQRFSNYRIGDDLTLLILKAL